jgi:hypothetical protein
MLTVSCIYISMYTACKHGTYAHHSLHMCAAPCNSAVFLSLASNLQTLCTQAGVWLHDSGIPKQVRITPPSCVSFSLAFSCTFLFGTHTNIAWSQIAAQLMRPARKHYFPARVDLFTHTHTHGFERRTHVHSGPLHETYARVGLRALHPRIC